MIKREDFNGKNYNEMVEAINADLVMYSEQLASFTTSEIPYSLFTSSIGFPAA